MASEAKFHSSCRSQYLQTPEYWTSDNQTQKELQIKLEDAHNSIFTCIVNFVDEKEINNQEILRLDDLVKMYKEKVAKTDFKMKITEKTN